MQDPQDPKSKKIGVETKAQWVFSPDATLAIGIRPDFEGMRQTIKQNYGKPENDEAWFSVMKKFGVDAKALPKEYKVTPDATTAMIADELLLRAVDRMETDYLYGRRGAEMQVEAKPDTQLPLPFMGTKAQRAVMDQYGAFLNPNNRLRFVQPERVAFEIPNKLVQNQPPTRLMDELISPKVRMAYGEALDEWQVEYGQNNERIEGTNFKAGGFADLRAKFINVDHRVGPAESAKSLIHETQHAIQSTESDKAFNTPEVVNKLYYSKTWPQIAYNAISQGRNPFVLTNEEAVPPKSEFRRDDTLPSALSYLATPLSDQDMLALQQNRQRQNEIKTQLDMLWRQKDAIEKDTSLSKWEKADKGTEAYDKIRPLDFQLLDLEREEAKLARRDFDVLKLLELENFQWRNSANQIVDAEHLNRLTGLGLMYGETKPTPKQILNTLLYENSWHEREARFAEDSGWNYFAPGDPFGHLSRQLLQRP